MDHLKAFISRVYESISDKENKRLFGITTCGGIIYGWHIAGLHAFDFLTLELIFKGVAGLLSIFIAPPLGTFMNDVYKLKIRPRIFKKPKP